MDSTVTMSVENRAAREVCRGLNALVSAARVMIRYWAAARGATFFTAGAKSAEADGFTTRLFTSGSKAAFWFENTDFVAGAAS